MKTLKITTIICLLVAFFNIQAEAQNEPLDKGVNAVVANYLALKNVLITANGNEAENKAKALLAAINDVPKKSMDAAQLAVWSKYEFKLQFDSRHISEVNHVDHQREHFASLSTNLYAVLKGLKVNNQLLYYQYCTMNKLYYISETSAGKDPYMGMALCSKVKDTLPAKK